MEPHWKEFSFQNEQRVSEWKAEGISGLILKFLAANQLKNI